MKYRCIPFIPSAPVKSWKSQVATIIRQENSSGMNWNSKKLVIALFLSAVSFSSAGQYASAQQLLTPEQEAASQKRLEWWREARFGMFIHWGLYAVPAGEWKGQPVPGLGEWIMNHAKIPVVEYEQFAKRFDPEKFNAEQWVGIAKNAGVKYIVITSKHHDGFAMFGSKASKYNIVDATPFHRDPLKELAAACQKAGIRLGFYYSQTQDWHEPDGVGNTWDFPDESKKNFDKYFQEKVIPQVRELLTGYGPVALIWFDTPRNITKEQSQELADLVHKLQPNCLVSGRVGHGFGDYDSAGDNQITVGKVNRDWETPVTLNDTWGFKKDDNNWKPTSILIQQMAKVASRGGNYLLNVGPTSEGVIPEPSVERLTAVGEWVKVNGNSIYASNASPYPYQQPWGTITSKPSKLYLHVFHWSPNELVLYGLKNKVQKATLLADPKPLKFSQEENKQLDTYTLRISVPAAAPDKNDSVVEVDIAGEPQVDPSIVQEANGVVSLQSYLAELHKSAGSKLALDGRGVIEHWVNKEDYVDWDFKVTKPGTYDVTLLTSDQKYGKDWEGGHQVTIDVAGQMLKGTVTDNGKAEDPSNPYWHSVISKIGRVKIAAPGKYTLALRPDAIESQKNLGLTLVSVELKPAE